MSRRTCMMQYWAGCPQTPNSRWRRTLGVVQCCAERGWRTIVVFSRMPDDSRVWRPFADIGCEIMLEPRAARNFDWRCVWRTYRMLRRVRCDVFHCHNVHTSPLIGAALAGVPVRIWSKLAMSPYYEEGTEPRGIHRLEPSVRLSCALAHRVLAISNAVRGELLAQRVSADKVAVLPVPVEARLYRECSGGGFRESLGAAPSDILITSVGRAAWVKGWDVLVRAFSRVRQTVPSARLVLVGSTTSPDEAEFTNRLQSLAADLGIADRVHFTGQRADIPTILRASDIFAFPSRSEGQGLALTEALAAGLACVASNVGGIPELITHGDNGLLFPREDVNELARQLVTVITDGDLRGRMTEKAAQCAGRWDMPGYVDRLMEHYESLLNTG